MQAWSTRFGRIDVVVNNAGVHDSKSLEEASEADWDRILTNNLKSMYLVVKAALPYLKETKGRIVNMSSMAGVVGQGNAAAYASSKGGIVILSKNLALDLAQYGIRVNCICPGWVETPLVNQWFPLQPDEAAARQYIGSDPSAGPHRNGRRSRRGCAVPGVGCQLVHHGRCPARGRRRDARLLRGGSRAHYSAGKLSTSPTTAY